MYLLVRINKWKADWPQKVKRGQFVIGSFGQTTKAKASEFGLIILGYWKSQLLV